MKPLSLLTMACVVLLLMPPRPGSARQHGEGDPKSRGDRRLAAPGPDEGPEDGITPNTIRIQSTDRPEEGRWVVMPGFSELGSPCFSRDGKWIAFDAYEGGYNNSPS